MFWLELGNTILPMKKIINSPKLRIFEGHKTSGLVEKIFEKNSLLEEWKLSEVIEHYNDKMGLESELEAIWFSKVFSSMAECLSSLEQA